MLLYFTHKSHTGPPLRYAPVIGCKDMNLFGENKGNYLFSSILSQKNCEWVQEIAGFRDVS